MPNQNTQAIQNPKAPFPQTPQMNERDFVNDLLSQEKYMTNAYVVALNEASHQHYFDDLMAIYTETQKMQHTIFNLMFEKGWYNLEAAETQKVQQSFQQHQGYLNQLPYQGNSK